MPHKKSPAAPFREEAMLPIDMLTVPQESAEVPTEDGSKGMVFSHYFSKPGVHPFEEIEWDRREAVISDASGKTIFKQTGVEVPKFWSQLATNVVVSKYFHGKVNTEDRESSVKQLVNRVSRTIADWGTKDGYFAFPRRWGDVLPGIDLPVSEPVRRVQQPGMVQRGNRRKAPVLGLFHQFRG